jgi:UDP-N-acetylmuramoyl-tripeptide--D-alanyl-D-alanine ligase
MAFLYSVAELVAATGGRAEGLRADGVDSISIDSREIGPDALFVAIEGDRFDGHDFVQSALDNGAVAALVSQEKADGIGDRLIVVPDALGGLIDLGKAARARCDGTIVAVTGSVGKTTTKEAIRTVLTAAGETHASIKSFNNHWGVPLMLARMPRTTAFGVFELGMNAPGEIEALTALVRPHIAVITSIAPAHLEHLGTMEAIAEAKAEIFTSVASGGTAVINADHEHLPLLVQRAREAGLADIVTFGFADGADWQIVDFVAGADESRATVIHDGTSFEIKLQAPGRHMISNAVAALIVADRVEVERSVALEALSGFGAQEGRGRKVVLGNPERPLVLTDESYNANTASMRAAMDVFASQRAPSGRKVLILGDMLELGAASESLHRSLAPAVRNANADLVFLVGSGMAALADELGKERVAAHAPTSEDIAETVLNALAFGDAVMVKGSNGVRLTGLVKQIRDRFA